MVVFGLYRFRWRNHKLTLGVLPYLTLCRVAFYAAAWRSMAAIRLFEASTAANARAMAALACAVDLVTWPIMPSSSCSSSAGRNAETARRIYSPIESLAAFAFLAISLFSAEVTSTGIRSVACHPVNYYSFNVCSLKILRLVAKVRNGSIIA